MEQKQTFDVMSGLAARHAEIGGQIDENVSCVGSAAAHLAQIATQQGKICACHVTGCDDKKETAVGTAISLIMLDQDLLAKFREMRIGKLTSILKEQCP
ncbi:hypothetical protein CIG75_12985 [Tumebacillus algifaecis]|uniref:Uncharacterized protein n=1 Tax=Tumebacillus algifaecis TaxID=1214604 RepID=A0A223D343_9BACL|nr:hypothetical protein [Tumebacillus algifaecis]ASS75814.1 hypothetical protein CIG75_12985 [Tumebacillus algifaecis]